jgi:iron complex transport system substrate-binding protein
MPAFALLLAARVASLNLCTDEYLLLLARPSEIASVSFLSQDRRESALWQQARPYPANNGSLEGVLRTKPDVVMTMGGGGRATSLIARRLGLGTVDLRPTVTIDDVAANFRTVATALGEPARAAPWVQRLQRLKVSAPRKQADAIWISGGGQSLTVPSAGADWMRLAGLKQRPLQGGRASLETLLTRPPAVLVESSYRRGQVSAGTAWRNHPIVRGLRSKRVRTDGRAWTCMGPLLIPEIERLRAWAK